MKLQFRFAAVTVIAFAAMTACSPGPDGPDGDSVPVQDTIDVNNFKVKGQNFMMPSPMQIANMIQRA
jgi:hypothetical protein